MTFIKRLFPRYHLTALWLIILSFQVSASVDNQLGSYFDSLGYATNVTSPSAYKSQSANYYSSGGLSLKNPVTNLEPMQITLPSVSAGCGGIDVFGGGFSFINAAQFKQFLQNVGRNAAPLALKLGIQTLTPQLASIQSEMQEWANKFNNMSLNSCEAAQSLVDVTGLTGLAQTAGKEMACIRAAVKAGADTADAKARCSGSGANAAIASAANDSEFDQLPVNVNIAWKYIQKNTFLASDKGLAELVMSLSGTVVYDGVGKKHLIPSLYINNEQGMEALLKGGKTVPVYRCDTKEKCLKVTKATITVSATKAFYPQVKAMLTAIAGAYHGDTKLNAKERSFLEITPLPVLKMLSNVMESNESVDHYADDYAQIMTAKLLSQYLSDLLRLAQAGLQESGETKDADDIQRSIESMQAYLNQAPKQALERLVMLNQLIDQRKRAEKRIQDSMDSLTHGW
ncbi:conjugal transfer protein TraH [Vibrio artabrorum]|uniref:conjugal transfer protein TraH n=1 Tax=Vibrio artabrorum TaxID=446374 RepID=UPI00354D11DE